MGEKGGIELASLMDLRQGCLKSSILVSEARDEKIDYGDGYRWNEQRLRGGKSPEALKWMDEALESSSKDTWQSTGGFRSTNMTRISATTTKQVTMKRRRHWRQ